MRLRDGASIVSSCAGSCEVAVALELSASGGLNVTADTGLILSGGGLASNGSALVISNGSALTMRGNGFVMGADVALRGGGQTWH